jgi:outer membrane lipase/esterase
MPFSAPVKPWLFAIVLAFALFAPGRADADDRHGHHRPFDRIVVFGDSLSDSGNLFALTGGAFVAPPAYGMDGFDSNGIPEVVALIPERAYESKRLSNGLTWVELLGGALGLGRNVKPAFALPFDPHASNFAVAGATAANLLSRDPESNPLHLSTQVAAYLGRGASSDADFDTLYVIAIGGNDVRAVFTFGTTDILTEALVSVRQNITDLYRRAGARKFLVWNIPNLGGTPAFQRLQNGVAPFFPGIPGIADTATALIAHPDLGYNRALRDLLHFLPSGLPGLEIVQFDAFTRLGAVQANPRRYGLLDASTACIQPNVPPFAVSESPFRCAQPDRHFFWDGIHPTRAGHAIIAFLVGKELVTAALQDH